jgi:hypothetical protein
MPGAPAPGILRRARRLTGFASPRGRGSRRTPAIGQITAFATPLLGTFRRDGRLERLKPTKGVSTRRVRRYRPAAGALRTTHHIPARALALRLTHKGTSHASSQQAFTYRPDGRPLALNGCQQRVRQQNQPQRTGLRRPLDGNQPQQFDMPDHAPGQLSLPHYREGAQRPNRFCLKILIQRLQWRNRDRPNSHPPMAYHLPIIQGHPTKHNGRQYQHHWSFVADSAIWRHHVPSKNDHSNPAHKHI